MNRVDILQFELIKYRVALAVRANLDRMPRDRDKLREDDKKTTSTFGPKPEYSANSRQFYIERSTEIQPQHSFVREHI